MKNISWCKIYYLLIFLIIIVASIVVTGEFGSSSNISLFQNISCPTIVGTSTLASCSVNAVSGNCYPYCPGANIGIRCFSKSPYCLIKSSLTALSLSLSQILLAVLMVIFVLLMAS